ncbi:MAG: Maltodextrin ABC transporter, permease protein MdxG, partial [uncultured Frankineae bacterium]
EDRPQGPDRLDRRGDRDHVLRPHPRGLDPLAVAEGRRRHQQPEVLADGLQPGELPHRLRERPVHHGAAQLGRHLAHRHVHLGGAGDVRRLRRRPPGVPRQAAAARAGPGHHGLPDHRDRHAAVQPVAHGGPLRHLARADHPLPVLLAPAVGLRPVRLLPRDPVGDGAGRAGRRCDGVAGVPQGDHPARGARGLHGGDPDVLRDLERLHLRHHAHRERSSAPRPRRARLLQRRQPVLPADRTHRRGIRGGHHPGDHPGARLPAEDRRRTHQRRRQGL